jgi:hypothetical protein
VPPPTEIVAKTGLTRSILYRHLPARQTDPVTVVTTPPAETSTVSTEPETDTGSDDRLECPNCRYRYQPSTRREMIPHLDDRDTVWLHLGRDGQVRERRHCARYQPHEQVVAVSCTRAGRGR